MMPLRAAKALDLFTATHRNSLKCPALRVTDGGEVSPPRLSVEQVHGASGTRHRITVASAEDFARADEVSDDGETKPIVGRTYPAPRSGLASRERVETYAVCYVGEVEVRHLLRYSETARPTQPCAVCGLYVRRRVHARRLTPCPHTPE